MSLEPIEIVFYLLTLVISITIHEFMHAVTGHHLGDTTAERHGRLTLNPAKHVSLYLTILLPLFLAFTGAPVFGAAKPVPFNPYAVRYGKYGAGLIAIAGPLSNLLMASFMALWLNMFNISSDLGLTFASIFIYTNLGFFIFNMIPIPPLDGSRVLRAVSPDFIGDKLDDLEKFGLMPIFFVIFFFNPYIGRILNWGIDYFTDIFNI